MMIMGASFAFSIAPSVMGTLICTHANYLCRIAISLVVSYCNIGVVNLIALSGKNVFAVHSCYITKQITKCS